MPAQIEYLECMIGVGVTEAIPEATLVSHVMGRSSHGSMGVQSNPTGDWGLRSLLDRTVYFRLEPSVSLDMCQSRIQSFSDSRVSHVSSLHSLRTERLYTSRKDDILRYCFWQVAPIARVQSTQSNLHLSSTVWTGYVFIFIFNVYGFWVFFHAFPVSCQSSSLQLARVQSNRHYAV